VVVDLAVAVSVDLGEAGSVENFEAEVAAASA
jgi:hypothetical protein